MFVYQTIYTSTRLHIGSQLSTVIALEREDWRGGREGGREGGRVGGRGVGTVNHHGAKG